MASIGRLRKLAPQTQVAYVRSVRRLASYLRRPPDTATVEDLRNFQLHLPSYLNACGKLRVHGQASDNPYHLQSFELVKDLPKSSR